MIQQSGPPPRSSKADKSGTSDERDKLLRQQPPACRRCAKPLLASAACAALVLVVLAISSGLGRGAGARADAPPAQQLRTPVVLHQSVASAANLTESERGWRRSWERLGFTLRLSDDAACRRDMVT
jgi:hypothetical protein